MSARRRMLERIDRLTSENIAQIAAELGARKQRMHEAAPDLYEALKDLIRAYVRLLEAGKDRIESLGGQCDSIEQMEREDPSLRDARAVLAKVDKP